MKKIILIVSVLFISMSSYSQRGNTAQILKTFHKIKKPTSSSRSGFDTLYTPAFNGIAYGNPLAGCDEVQLFSDGATGYAAGNNQFGDKAKMMKYYSSGIIGIYQTLFVCAYKTISDPNELITSTIYTVDSITHGPGDTVYVADDAISMSNVYYDGLSPNYTGINFPSTIPFCDSFFISVSLPSITGDTIAIAATTDGCYPGIQVAYELRADNTFQPFNDGTSNSWELNTELLICPVVELGQCFNSLQNFIANNSLKLFPAFPVPSQSSMVIKYETHLNSNVQIQIVDLTGRIIKVIDTGNQTAGTHLYTLNTSDLTPGIYNYGVKTEKTMLFSRFTKN